MGLASSSSLDQLVPGFRVVHVCKGSPAHLAGLRPVLDHIVSFNGINAFDLKSVKEFKALVASCEGQVVTAIVYNSRTALFRECPISIKRNIDEDGLLLGASVRLVPNISENPIGLLVNNVPEGSPGHRAGLQANTDCILGICGYDLQTGVNDLIDCLFAAEAAKESIELLVYNLKTDHIRTLIVEPSINTETPLGCQVQQIFLEPIISLTDESDKCGSNDLTTDESSIVSEHETLLQEAAAIRELLVLHQNDREGDEISFFPLDHIHCFPQSPYPAPGMLFLIDQ